MILNLTKEEWAPFDDAMKSWRGPHPYQKGETIGYWVLRGWFDIEEDRAEGNYLLLQKKRYAEQKIGSWYPMFEAGEITKETIELKEAEDFYELQLLIYDEDRIRAPSSEIELYEADVIQVAEGVRSAFKTPGYERGWFKALYESKVKGAVTKLYFVGVGAGKAFGSAVKNIVKNWWGSENKLRELRNLDFKGEFLRAFDQTQEVLAIGSMYLKDLFFRIVLPYFTLFIVSHLGIFPSLAAGSFNGAMAKLFIGENESWSAFGGGLLISSLIAAVFGTVLKKFLDSNSEAFNIVTQDIFAGAKTPEGIEKEYNEKIQDIMDNPNLSWREMKEQMLELHKEFQLKVRPAIEKGLYLSGTMADQGANEVIDKIQEGMENMFATIKSKLTSRSKKGSSASLPISLKMVEAKVMLTLKCEIEGYMKNGEGATLMYKLLSGEEPIDEEIKEHLQMNPALVASVQKELEKQVDLSQFSVAN